MSRASDLLPPIRLLASAEEAVGKTVWGVAGCGAYDDDGFFLFTDGTAIALEVAQDRYGDGHYLRVSAEVSERMMVYHLRDAGLLRPEDAQSVIEALDKQRKEQQDQERLQRDRAEYERLRAKFGGEA